MNDTNLEAFLAWKNKNEIMLVQMHQLRIKHMKPIGFIPYCIEQFKLTPHCQPELDSQPSAPDARTGPPFTREFEP